MLYSRYANPKELMHVYIKRRRFGEFVEECIESENRRRIEEAEKADEQKLWMMYVHCRPDKSFKDWKAEVLKPAAEQKGSRDENMTDEDITKLINGLFSEGK